MLIWMFISCFGSTDDDLSLESVAQPADSKTDVLLVTIDTTRADRIGCYGDPLANTPVLDALAANGILFREAHTPVPLTLPAHASLLTGRLPSSHGLRDNAGFRLDDSFETLAEVLADGGYRTGAFVSAFVLDSAWGLDQGFDEYRDPFHPSQVAAMGAFGEVELPSAEVVNAALSWWKGSQVKTNQPRFAWVHLYDPHTPWTLHPGEQSDPYRSEIAYADQMLGRLVEEVGPDTLVVVTSDHGEGLWDEGEREHGVLVGRSVSRVPLVIRPPTVWMSKQGITDTQSVESRTRGPILNRRPKQIDSELILDSVPDAPVAAVVVESTVSLLDVAPTIAEMVGFSMSNADGRSLLHGDGWRQPDGRVAYTESLFGYFHFGWSGLWAIQDESFRIEKGVLSTSIHWKDGTKAEQSGDDWSHLLGLGEESFGTIPQPTEPMDVETAEALQALGYLTSVVDVVGKRPDPRDKIDTLVTLRAAEQMSPADAIQALESLKQREPLLVDGYVSLSLIRASQGDLDGALAESLSVLEIWPEHPTALSNAAGLALNLHQYDLAIELARRLQRINPSDPRGFRIETSVWVKKDEAQEVIRVGELGLVASPRDPNLHYLVGLSRIHTKSPEQGIQHLEEARKFGSEATDIDLWIAYAHDQAGNIDLAVDHYERATLSMPSDLRPWAMAGVMLADASRCDEAVRYLVNVSRRMSSPDAKIIAAMRKCKALK